MGFCGCVSEKARVGVLYLASRVSLQSRDLSGQQWEIVFWVFIRQIYLSSSLSMDSDLMGQFAGLHKMKLRKIVLCAQIFKYLC